MQTSEFNNTEAQAYLLGKLSEADAARLEAGWLADETSYAQLQSAQDELLDDYVYDRLSVSDRQQFERHVLASPFLRERVAFAQTLAQHVQQHDAEGRVTVAPTVATNGWSSLREWLFGGLPSWGWAAAAAGLLFVFAGGWWWLNQRQESPATLVQLQETPSPIATPVPNITPEPRPMPAASPMDRPATNTLASIVLSPLAMRDNGALPRLRLPAAARTVQFQLRLAEVVPGQLYRVEIETSDEAKVWSRDRLRPRPATAPTQFSLQVPVSSLAAGDYLIKVQRRAADHSYEDVATYSVRIQ